MRRHAAKARDRKGAAARAQRLAETGRLCERISELVAMKGIGPEMHIQDRRIFAVLSVIALPLVLGACDEGTAEQPEQPLRAIKYVVLSERAGLQERRISGLVEAGTRSSVAFEIGGQVIALLQNAGDKVEQGKLIARLDPEPFRLRVTQAENAFAQAQSQLDDAGKKFQQTRDLFERGYATRTAFDSAEAAMKGAEGAVGVAESELKLALRDLAKADLLAPYAGVIARRNIEVFEEVNGGQAIYEMQTSTDDKVTAALPETLINRVSLGDGVEVRFPPLGDALVSGTVREIAPLAGDANAYPIEVALDRSPPGLRAGMSAEVLFRFASDLTGEAFVVPLTAVKPAAGAEGDATVFVYQPDSQTLDERIVKIANVQGNDLQVVGAIAEGEIIAAAGISYLYDGMRVKLLDPALLR